MVRPTERERRRDAIVILIQQKEVIVRIEITSPLGGVHS